MRFPNTDIERLRVQNLIHTSPFERAISLLLPFHAILDNQLRNHQNIRVTKGVSISIVFATHDYDAFSDQPTSGHLEASSRVLAKGESSCEVWLTSKESEGIIAVREIGLLYAGHAFRGEAVGENTVRCIRSYEWVEVYVY